MDVVVLIRESTQRDDINRTTKQQCQFVLGMEQIEQGTAHLESVIARQDDEGLLICILEPSNVLTAVAQYRKNLLCCYVAHP